MIGTLMAGLALSSAPTTLVLKGLDPVLLVEGKEVAGSPVHSATYLRHEYRFSSAENKARFEGDPVRFAVQNGGACGKMGALTGKGSPERWTVAEGKIFLFASEGCRTAFLANRAQYFAPVEVPPASSSNERAAAKRLFEKVLRAHGGHAIKAAKQIEWTYDTPYRDNGVDKIWHTRHALVGANKFAQWEEWDAGRVFFVMDGKRAWEGKKGEVYGVHPGETRELEALFARHPAGILSGAAEPLKTIEGGLMMARGDIVFRVLLDPATSRIERVLFRDRFAGPVQEVEIEYSDYADFAGIALPRKERARTGNGEWKKPREVASWVVNGPVPIVFEEAKP